MKQPFGDISEVKEVYQTMADLFPTNSEHIMRYTENRPAIAAVGGLI